MDWKLAEHCDVLVRMPLVHMTSFSSRSLCPSPKALPAKNDGLTQSFFPHLPPNRKRHWTEQADDCFCCCLGRDVVTLQYSFVTAMLLRFLAGRTVIGLQTYTLPSPRNIKRILLAISTEHQHCKLWSLIVSSTDLDIMRSLYFVIEGWTLTKPLVILLMFHRTSPIAGIHNVTSMLQQKTYYTSYRMPVKFMKCLQDQSAARNLLVSSSPHKFIGRLFNVRFKG